MVRAGSAHMLGLRSRSRCVSLMCCRLFRSGCAGIKSAGSAAVAGVVGGGVIDDGLVVGITDVCVADVIHRAVVVEGAVVPISAFIAHTTKTEAVVDAAVEADVRAPVSAIPGVGIAAPSPVTRRPKHTNHGRLHPGTRYPEVTFTAVRPVAGRPQITGSRDCGLLVDRQPWRSDLDRHAELRGGNGRYGQNQKSQKQQTEVTHFESTLPDHPSIARLYFAAAGCVE